jgi:hypothetical protein
MHSARLPARAGPGLRQRPLAAAAARAAAYTRAKPCCGTSSGARWFGTAMLGCLIGRRGGSGLSLAAPGGCHRCRVCASAGGGGIGGGSDGGGGGGSGGDDSAAEGGIAAALTAAPPLSGKEDIILLDVTGGGSAAMSRFAARLHPSPNSRLCCQSPPIPCLLLTMGRRAGLVFLCMLSPPPRGHPPPPPPGAVQACAALAASAG